MPKIIGAIIKLGRIEWSLICKSLANANADIFELMFPDVRKRLLRAQCVLIKVVYYTTIKQKQKQRHKKPKPNMLEDRSLLFMHR